MKFHLRNIAGSLLCLLIAMDAAAASARAKPTDAAQARDQIAQIVDRALRSNPEMTASEAAIQAAEERLSGAGLPLNNPELEAGAERTDINTYRLGISQTIDWYGKRNALEQVARQQLVQARLEYAALALEKSRELLDAIGRISTLQETLRLSVERASLLTRFSKLAVRRHAAGDLPRADLQLARLSVAEAQMQVARVRAELIQARSDFERLSGFSPSEMPPLPPVAESSSPPDESTVRPEQHPQVRAALAAARVARQQIASVDRGRKADPTVGLAGGREGGEKLIGLSLSLPLQVRNDFESDVRAARAEALRAERLARQAHLELKARLSSARERHRIISAAWRAWTETGQASLRKRLKLLETLWKAGEISSSDYLLQLQQTLDTRITGNELRGDLWRAWVEKIAASGTLNEWLKASE